MSVFSILVYVFLSSWISFVSIKIRNLWCITKEYYRPEFIYNKNKIVMKHIRHFDRISENYENSLYREIRAAISNSNSSTEESVEILRLIADELEAHRSRKEETISRWSKESDKARRHGGLDPENEF